MIMIYFLPDRGLLADLAKIAWDVLDLFYKNSINKDNTIQAAAISMQTFSYFLSFNLRLHIPVSNGCFVRSAMFYASPIHIDAALLEPLFR